MTTVVMAGKLNEFDVPSVLQAVSLSRQYTVLRLWDRNKKETGEIRLKAGQLLDAVHGTMRGRLALRTILSAKTHHSFRVERVGDAVEGLEPVGSLASLLLEASSVGHEPSATKIVPPRVRAVPPPPPSPSLSSPILSSGSAASAPVPASTTTVGHASGAPSISEVGASIAEIARATKPLEGLLLAKLPECLLCKSWFRTAPSIPAEVLATYVARIVDNHRMCLGDFLPESRDPLLTLELATATVMLQPVASELICAYVFAPSTPLGLVRLAVSQIHGQIEQRTAAELMPLPVAN